jgi:hypothetical protein
VGSEPLKFTTEDTETAEIRIGHPQIEDGMIDGHRPPLQVLR